MARHSVISVDVLLEELERLPAQGPIAVRVVQATSDSKSTAADLAKVIELDPALTARLIRVANSAYYGLSRRVASITLAVTVVGFSTVRAIAGAAASGLFDAHDGVPEHFWEHSLSTAAAASVLAPRFGAASGDAFAVGLLHDLGSVLLFRGYPHGYAALVERVSAGEERERVELEVFGLTHQRAGGRVFAAWSFPEEFIEAIEGHHGEEDGTRRSPLAETLHVADALSLVYLDGAGFELGTSFDPSMLDADADELDALLVRIRDHAAATRAAFGLA
jgi:HD-like signal output (HDOD) protein